LISVTIRPTICNSLSPNSQERTVSSVREIGMAVKSAIDMPFTVTARLAGRSRLPPHSLQRISDMYCSSVSRSSA
jgi:hypothetical protein